MANRVLLVLRAAYSLLLLVFMSSFWIHDSAVVIGDVSLADDVSVWPTAVIRGDVERIAIGARSNVQDGAVIHADPGKPTIVGEDCVIGHRAVVHGTIREDGVLVGMGAILLNNVRVGRGSIIAAGAVVTEGTVVPPGSLVVGVPGKVVRALSAEQLQRLYEVEVELALQVGGCTGCGRAGLTR